MQPAGHISSLSYIHAVKICICFLVQVSRLFCGVVRNIHARCRRNILPILILLPFSSENLPKCMVIIFKVEQELVFISGPWAHFEDNVNISGLGLTVNLEN
jgi:hypothetical protein